MGGKKTCNKIQSDEHADCTQTIFSTHNSWFVCLMQDLAPNAFRIVHNRFQHEKLESNCFSKSIASEENVFKVIFRCLFMGVFLCGFLLNSKTRMEKWDTMILQTRIQERDWGQN